METEFFKLSKCMLVGAKPSNRSALKKMISNYGCDSQNVETFVDIKDALGGIENKKFNFLIFDDDCKDMEMFDSLIDAFISRLKDYNESLFIYITADAESKYLDDCNQIPNFFVLLKPYTIGTFNQEIDKFLEHKKQIQIEKEKSEKQESKRTIKAKKSYKDFKQLIEGMEENPDDDGFIKVCSTFLQSLETTVDYESLAKVLSMGIASKRYKDLDLFVEGWLDSLPVEAYQIPDISRIILYNNNFELFNKLNSDDEYASLAIGIGMVISASVLIDEENNEETALEFIEKGVKLAGYKQIVLEKAKNILTKISSQEKVDKVLKSFPEAG